MIRHAHRIGAVFYVLWGLLHVVAGWGMIAADAEQQLDNLSTAPLPTEAVPEGLAPIVQAGLAFHGYNLLWFGLFAIVVAVAFNWRNSPEGEQRELPVLDGFWYGPGGPRNSEVAAVLAVFSIFPWTVGAEHHEPWVYHNPWAGDTLVRELENLSPSARRRSRSSARRWRGGWRRCCGRFRAAGSESDAPDWRR